MQQEVERMTQRHWLIEWLDVFVRALIRTTLICLTLYVVYRIKSAAGINFSQHYHAIDFFQTPLDVMVDIFRA